MGRSRVELFEAVRLICDVLRTNQIRRCAAIRVEPENLRSIRVAEKSGFRYIGDFPSSRDTQADGTPKTLSLYLLDLSREARSSMSGSPNRPASGTMTRASWAPRVVPHDRPAGDAHIHKQLGDLSRGAAQSFQHCFVLEVVVVNRGHDGLNVRQRFTCDLMCRKYPFPEHLWQRHLTEHHGYF